MRYFTVWEGPAPADDDAARATHLQLINRWQLDPERVTALFARLRGEKTRLDPTPAIASYVAALVERWPDPCERTDGIHFVVEDESLWAEPPLNNATGPFFYAVVKDTRAEEMVTSAAQLAAEHRLNCYDPQAGLLTPPAIPSRWRWGRRKR